MNSAQPLPVNRFKGVPMAQEPLVFTVRIARDSYKQDRWLSPALQLPGAKLLGIAGDAGHSVTGATLTDGAILAPSGEEPLTVATLEVPGDLTLQSVLEQAKLDLEHEKIALEEANRRRTWQWSIGSAVLTAVVTLTVAYMNKPDPARPIVGTAPSSDSVEACRASLQRLPLLAATNNQTVASLAEAIRRHQADCDEVLVKVLGMR
jgi:hypothetical protein